MYYLCFLSNCQKYSYNTIILYNLGFWFAPLQQNPWRSLMLFVIFFCSNPTDSYPTLTKKVYKTKLTYFIMQEKYQNGLTSVFGISSASKLRKRSSSLRFFILFIADWLISFRRKLKICCYFYYFVLTIFVKTESLSLILTTKPGKGC